MDNRRNLFLIAKHATNSTAKYADCNRIVISFNFHNQSLLMSVTDNGIGFDPEASTSGNGVCNMKTKANVIGSFRHRSHSNKMIAEACFITLVTVQFHIKEIYRKLHVNSKSKAIFKSLKEKLH